MQPSRDAFQNFEYGMKVVGWLPSARGRHFDVALKVFMVSTFYVPFGIFVGYIKDFANYTPGELFAFLQISFNAVGYVAKLIIIVLNLWRFHQVKELLNRQDEFCNEGAERIQINFTVRRCNLIYLVYHILYSGYIISTCLISVLNGVAPWSIYTPFLDWRKSTTSLWLSSSLQLILTHFFSMQCQLSDLYPVLCAIMMHLHLNLLQQKVSKLRTNPSESEQESYEELVKCIEYHGLIKEYSDLIRPLISRYFFIQFMIIGLSLGCAMANILLIADFWSRVGTVVYIGLVMFQTFPFCFYCELIKDNGQDLALAIFHSNWVGASKGYKSALISFMHCAQQPIEFTAGSIFPIGMETSIKMAKLAFSVITLAKELNLGEK